MGVLSDLFIAADDEISQLSSDAIPESVFTSIDVKGIDLVKLSSLLCILSNRDFEIAVIDEFEMVRQDSDEGPWIHKFPDEFRNRLWALDGEAFKKAASLWAATEEFRLEQWPEDVVEDTLRNIVDLAKQAKQNDKGIFLWTSL